MTPMTPMKPMKLLNPGPVTLTARVRSALVRGDMCHREEEFATLTKSVLTRLGRLYDDAITSDDPYRAVMITGSGTSAVEAMIGSLVPRGARALVVSNGVYGERAAAMLRAQNKGAHEVRSAWTDAIDLDAVDRALAAEKFSHVIGVHHETTTGRRNDIAALGRLCTTHGVPLLLDAVSSFGGEEIRFAEWNLEACAATANKCLHGVPGIAFVLAKSSVFSARESGATSVYLDLHRYVKEQAAGFSPFTQAVQPLFALDEALDELLEAGGWRARHAHYRALSARVMAGLRELGIEMLLDSPEAYSSIMTSYKLPSGVTYARLHDDLKEAGFIIYAGQGHFNGAIFRIAVMGDLGGEDIERLLANVRRIVSRAT
jgi:2-aminoethylphosphonate-pyruvate transaminase